MHANLRERLQEVLDRGKRDGISDAQITTDNLEFMTTIIVSGCVSSRGMFTRFLGQSAPAQESPAFWRDYAVRFILRAIRSEEHTSELQSLMRISYAVFCLTKKK